MRALRSTGSVELEVARSVSSLKSPGKGDANINTQISIIEETEKKKRPLSSSVSSPPLKKQATASMTEERKVDPSVLQFQNQKLCQQLEAQKDKVQDLEQKLQALEKKQASYDANLITVNRIWGQLIDDLGILAVKANGSLNGSNGCTLSSSERAGEEVAAKKGDLFLDKLVHSCPKVEPEEEDSPTDSVLEKALEARSQQTIKILKCVVGGIEQQRHRNEELHKCAKDHVSDKEVVQALEENEASLREEVERTRRAIDDLHVQHRSLLSEVTLLRDVRLKQQAQMTSLSEQLEDTQAELDSAKKKILNLRQQVEAGGSQSTMPVQRSASNREMANGDQSRASGEEVEKLRASLQEAQAVAEKRLKEIEAKHEEHLDLLRKLKDLEASLRDEQRIKSSKAYCSLAEQLSTSRGETDRLKAAFDNLQRDRVQWGMREKDMQMKAEAGETARRHCHVLEGRVKDLEGRLKTTMEERDALHLQVEELKSEAARSDTVEEMRRILKIAQGDIQTLTKQVTKYKGLSEELPAVKAENQCLQTVLIRKSEECRDLRAQCKAAKEVLDHHKQEVQGMRSKGLEMRLLVDMFSRESLDRREMKEVKASEARALAQVEQLRAELDEHGLALRVRAANEAEAACQQRLAAAESEVTSLRERVVQGEKKILELEEGLKGKSEESEIYASEIETISTAYEEMQTQNKRLLQQISERDEYNTQLIAESVKAKLLQTSVKGEKEVMEAKMNQVVASAAIDRQRVQHLEEQLKGTRDQLEKALEETRRARSEVESTKRLQGEAERESATLKRAAVEAERDNSVREKRMRELEEQVERERHKVRRLEEDKSVLVEKVQKAEHSRRGHSSAAQEVEDLQEELREYKRTLKCSVCHDRRKEVCITKCFHLFCSPCIQRNLELRHRKCPGCGVPFGQGDVRQIYL